MGHLEQKKTTESNFQAIVHNVWDQIFLKSNRNIPTRNCQVGVILIIWHSKWSCLNTNVRIEPIKNTVFKSFESNIHGIFMKNTDFSFNISLIKWGKMFPDFSICTISRYSLIKLTNVLDIIINTFTSNFVTLSVIKGRVIWPKNAVAMHYFYGFRMIIWCFITESVESTYIHLHWLYIYCRILALCMYVCETPHILIRKKEIR